MNTNAQRIERVIRVASLAGLWLAFASGWLLVLFLWLVRSRSPHLNWVSSSFVLAGLLYGLFAQSAFVLPAYKLCGSVTGCQP